MHFLMAGQDYLSEQSLLTGELKEANSSLARRIETVSALDLLSKKGVLNTLSSSFLPPLKFPLLWLPDA